MEPMNFTAVRTAVSFLYKGVVSNYLSVTVMYLGCLREQSNFSLIVDSTVRVGH